MKQQISAHFAHIGEQISAHLTPIEGQLSVHLTSIDYQSQHAQASAQIVRKNKYAAITLSSGYTSHAKQKKVNVPKAGIRSRGFKNYTFPAGVQNE